MVDNAQGWQESRRRVDRLRPLCSSSQAGSVRSNMAGLIDRRLEAFLEAVPGA
jgi:hypothetical protein